MTSEAVLWTNKPDESERRVQSRPVTWGSSPARALPAVVRAHLVNESDAKNAQPEGEGKKPIEEVSCWPGLVLTFHTETAADEFASLRFGTYIVEWLDPILQKVGPELGIDPVQRIDAGFFTGESLNDSERELIEDYCKVHKLTCLTRREWLEDIFFNCGYRGRGAIVSFNLPFNLSRIATRASAIHPKKLKKEEQLADDTLVKPNWINNFYAGGWRLLFNERQKKDEPGKWRERAYRPPALLKPINTRAAMYRWGRFLNWQDRETLMPWPYGKDRKNQAMQSCEPAQPAAQRQRRQEKSEDQLQPEKDRNQKEPASDRFYAGHFLDLRTLGLALSKDEDGSLRSLGELFGAKVLKTESREHDGKLTGTYLDYAMHNAKATLALYYAEMEEYKKHGLDATPDRIYSGASLGKAYLKQMGISSPPSMIADGLPYSQDELAGFGMSAYYSGRSEAQVVKTPVPVTYVDFHSMYPAVNILQGLWDFMRAEKIKVSDATQETIEFLKNIRPDDLYNPDTWKRLPVLCLVEPQEDLFPVRADFRPRKGRESRFQHRLKLAEIANAPLMWYALADCIVSAIRTGKPPRILAALKFTPEGNRELKSISIRGSIPIDPSKQDFFQALVEARDNTNDPNLAQALKIVANSTSYGIWAEVDIEEGERAVAAFSAGQRQAIIPHGERAGRYYCPPLASFITAGARLMLSLLEFEIEARGGASAFCDTDSLAIISSQAGGRLGYRDHRKRLCQIPVLTWAQVDEVLHKFESLNPYRSGKPLIKLEPENFEDRDPSQGRVDLYAYVIASKRYCLYVPGHPLKIVKVSYHTLGIVEPPCGAEGCEVTDWIEQFWLHKLTRRKFNPEWAGQPVEIHLEVSRPELRKGFRKICSQAQQSCGQTSLETGNKWMNSYLASVKPFNSIAVLVRRENLYQQDTELGSTPVIAPVGEGARGANRRWVAKNSGEGVYVLRSGNNEDGLLQEYSKIRRKNAELPITAPKTYAELWNEYQGNFESNALDSRGETADAATRGQLARPRVAITELHFTGKETVLQEELENGIVSMEEAETHRFVIGPERDPAAELVHEVLRLLSKAELKRLKISRWMADKIKDSEEPLASRDRSKQSSFTAELADYLHKHYPKEVGGAVGEEALRAFVENRRRLLEQWQAARLQLNEMPTKELMQIAGCSRMEATRIKRGQVEPRIETIKKIVNFYQGSS